MNLRIHASSRVPLFCFGTVSNFHMEGNYSRRADSSVTQLCRLKLLDLILSVSATEPRSMEKYFSPALNPSSLRRGAGHPRGPDFTSSLRHGQGPLGNQS
ncbi:hypothetical protein E3U43_017163 [Larimichthys crocea]|uniref:Uncharacterized protein n=1 Tax=Larimichthys crocea TaxID=215358 RepID=A0ACD3QYJ4_LARCR|nr:hypothetical protein E3U43_017163 [Larimichthys crocea]